MDILMDVGIAAAGVLAVYLAVKLLAGPIKSLLKFILHMALGLALLFAVNFVGAYFDFSLPISWLTGLVAGIGGIPGVVLLILIKLLF